MEGLPLGSATSRAAWHKYYNIKFPVAVSPDEICVLLVSNQSSFPFCRLSGGAKRRNKRAPSPDEKPSGHLYDFFLLSRPSAESGVPIVPVFPKRTSTPSCSVRCFIRFSRPGTTPALDRSHPHAFLSPDGGKEMERIWAEFKQKRQLSITTTTERPPISLCPIINVNPARASLCPGRSSIPQKPPSRPPYASDLIIDQGTERFCQPPSRRAGKSHGSLCPAKQSWAACLTMLPNPSAGFGRPPANASFSSSVLPAKILTAPLLRKHYRQENYPNGFKRRKSENLEKYGPPFRRWPDFAVPSSLFSLLPANFHGSPKTNVHAASSVCADNDEMRPYLDYLLSGIGTACPRDRKISGLYVSTYTIAYSPRTKWKSGQT